MMTDIATRRKHALAELHEQGVIKQEKMPAFVSLMMRIFPNQANPYYGDRVLYACQLGFVFALPFVALITPAFMFDEELQLPWPKALMIGLGIGGLAGAIFGAVMAGWAKVTHSDKNLTPWDQLDSPPSSLD